MRLIVKFATERNLSARGIAVELQRLGIPTTHGGMWRRNVVRATLRNPAYKGMAFFNHTKTVKVDGRLRQVPRAQAEHIVIPCPAIVGAEVWQAA